MASKYGINDIVEMKKKHACGTTVLRLLEWVQT
ncbi:Putative cytosolic protein [Staphylococcus aureus]|nr:Putative cytosolic protein [Staphylococcus aureus]